MKKDSQELKVESQESKVESEESKIENPSTFWLIGTVLVTLVGLFWRFWQLELKPMHHDEGVNGYFLTKLIKEGIYQYDPTNYHGPTLYYISLAFTKLFGYETFSVRASMAVWGVLIVLMACFLRRYIGNIGSLFAALMLALSPGMVFISRYYIHEIFFVFCSFGIVLGILYFIEGRKAGIFATASMSFLLLVSFMPSLRLATVVGGNNETVVLLMRVGLLIIAAFLVFMVMKMLLEWNNGTPIYLLLASASLALFFATKETAFITIGTMLIAIFCIWIWRKINKGFGESWSEPIDLSWCKFCESLGVSTDLILIIIATLFTFTYVFILFFTSFFTYPEGIGKAFEAYAVWTKTGTTDHTMHGYLAYAKWILKIESPILILSALGTLIAFIKAKHKFAMFIGLWALGLALAYSIIPYKTPWLALSFTLPMCLIAGYGINELFVSKNVMFKILAGILSISTFSLMNYQTYDLNFLRYDNDEMPYVYAHTKRGFLDLIKEVERYAEKSGKGKDATIEIVSSEYWSMPWYLRNYDKANFHGQIVPSNSAEMIVGEADKQENDLLDNYAAHYKYVGKYPLRPGVDLLLLVRKDLADKNAQELYKMEGVDLIKDEDK
ncbi:MAG: glycosyltransferase family 39 protein [Pyrinomonadaceae bacterium]|nr:glycosyltransferase family 39 protein [Pyrinomonadaceae bacterium]